MPIRFSYNGEHDNILARRHGRRGVQFDAATQYDPARYMRRALRVSPCATCEFVGYWPDALRADFDAAIEAARHEKAKEERRKECRKNSQR